MNKIMLLAINMIEKRFHHRGHRVTQKKNFITAARLPRLSGGRGCVRISFIIPGLIRDLLYNTYRSGLRIKSAMTENLLYNLNTPPYPRSSGGAWRQL